MGNPEIYYRRHLPHYQPPHATFHVVCRLAGSLPEEVIERLRAERIVQERYLTGIKDQKKLGDEWRAHQSQYFEKFDALLDGASTGPRWLSEPSVADIVAEAIRYHDTRAYGLLAYCIMPNHVHIVLGTVGRVADPTRTHVHQDQLRRDKPGFIEGRDGVPSYSLTDTIGSLKKYTALRANRILRRRGTFWQDESYDRVIRNGEELERTIRYVLYNPVKAGLIDTRERWPWTYWRPELVG